MAGPDRARRWIPSCAAALLLAIASCGEDGDALAQRQAEVAERGADVMPFDLDATTHSFTNTDDGGIQTVTADDPAETDQIQLVRAHLREERAKFARGDFEDPAAIHGHDMDGVAELAVGYHNITVTYTDLPDGGQLTYTTDRPDLVDAVHNWFARQVTDHGSHAESG